MKAKIKTKTLLTILQNLIKVVPTKSPTPILEDVILSASTLGVSILASDLETSVCSSIPAGEEADAEAIEHGSAAIPARLLLEIVKQVEDESIQITTGETSAEIAWSQGRSSIPVFDPDDFPEVKLSIEEGKDLEIPSEKMVDAINATLYAVGDDQIRPILNGIYFDATPEGLTLVSSDSHRLALHTIPSVTVTEATSFVLHKRNASMIKAFADQSENIHIRLDGEYATFQAGNTTIGVRSITGRYPLYRNVLPKDNTNILTADPKVLAAVVKRVQVCSNKMSNLIKLKIIPDTTGAVLEITAEDFGCSTTAYEKIGVDYSGDPLTIGFKGAFLLDLLNSFGDETIKISFADERRAVLAEPEGNPEEAHSSAVLMPVMTS